ncbi:MAG: SPFH domain-containing protein [Peptococcaceae bacterium]|nr:SPFH domain-containing protein [Peptococcaceae bacterium]
MAIFKVIKYDGPANVLAWKFPGTAFNTLSQLIVNESQEAVFFKGGAALDVFGAGTHTLSTNNIPLLSALVNMPFGGKSPFSAEVWFVNRLFVLDLKWGTTAPIQIQDPKYNVLLPVRTFGSFGVRISDTQRFITSLVGVSPYLDANALANYFCGILMNNISDCISSYLIVRKIGILELSAHLTEMSAEISERLSPIFGEYGVMPVNFSVMSVNVPENDKSVVSLKAALAKRAEMDIIGYNYIQERSFNTFENAAQNEGGAGTLIGAGLGLGMGAGIGGAVGTALGGLSPLDISESAGRKPDERITCPACGNLNLAQAKFCSKCGDKLENIPLFCSNCGGRIQPDCGFCPSCGKPIAKETGQ